MKPLERIVSEEDRQADAKRTRELAMPKAFIQLNDYLVGACYVKPQGENGRQYQNTDDSREHY